LKAATARMTDQEGLTKSECCPHLDPLPEGEEDAKRQVRVVRRGRDIANLSAGEIDCRKLERRTLRT
jgi:hypothetical protein